MSKPPEKSWEYIPNLEDEKDCVIQFELWNLRSIISNINNKPLAESPVYQRVIIPYLQKLINKLETLEDKINRELDIDGYKTIEDIIYE
tara:strand:- start:85 stop:351 length:267 start_codon:yes stop_codon:yes gene_type:complete